MLSRFSFLHGSQAGRQPRTYPLRQRPIAQLLCGKGGKLLSDIEREHGGVLFACVCTCFCSSGHVCLRQEAGGACPISPLNPQRAKPPPPPPAPSACLPRSRHTFNGIPSNQHSLVPNTTANTQPTLISSFLSLSLPDLPRRRARHRWIQTLQTNLRLMAPKHQQRKAHQVESVRRAPPNTVR